MTIIPPTDRRHSSGPLSLQILLPLLLVLLAAVSCSGDKTRFSPDDFSVPLYTPAYASGFIVEGTDDGSCELLRVENPWQGGDSVERLLMIVRDGADAPAGFTGSVLRGDAKRIVCMSSTHVAMLNAIGAADRIVGVSGLKFVSTPSVVAGSDTIAEVGYEGNIDYEALVGADPDLVLLYGISGASPMEAKLNELGIPFLYVGDYVEESPLGKAEWLVALAEACGLRGRGEEVFAAIPERYDALKARVDSTVIDAPSVMLNTPYGDSWFMPSIRSYMVRLINDAGGDYIYKKDTGNSSLPVDLEEAYLMTSEADMWLNVGSVSSLSDLRSAFPKFTDTRCFRNGDVYNFDRRVNAAGGNDFFETAIVEPDVVLRDLVKILHPELVSEDFVYYRKLD